MAKDKVQEKLDEGKLHLDFMIELYWLQKKMGDTFSTSTRLLLLAGTMLVWLNYRRKLMFTLSFLTSANTD